MHACAGKHRHMRAHVNTQTNRRACMRPCAQTLCMHVCVIYACMRGACMRALAHVRVCTHMCAVACARACVHARAKAHVCVCVCVSMHASTWLDICRFILDSTSSDLKMLHDVKRKGDQIMMLPKI